MWTRGELNPFLLHAMESFYRYTTGPSRTSFVQGKPLYMIRVFTLRHSYVEVDLSGIEPLISAMRMRRITSCATGPYTKVIIAEKWYGKRATKYIYASLIIAELRPRQQPALKRRVGC